VGEPAVLGAAAPTNTAPEIEFDRLPGGRLTGVSRRPSGGDFSGRPGFGVALVRVLNVRRALKDALKRWGFRFYRFTSRFGFQVVPVHYYSPLSDLHELERTLDTWATKSELPGLAFDREEQARNLKEICFPYQQEFSENRAYKQAVRERYGPGFGYIEA